VTVLLPLYLSAACALRQPSVSDTPAPEVPAGSHTAQLESSLQGLPATHVVDHRGSTPVKEFPRFSQCQIRIPVKLDSRSLWTAAEPDTLHEDITACLQTAVSEEVDVLVLPELALAFTPEERDSFLQEAKAVSRSTGMVVVAGSFYDEDRFSRLVVVGPEWIELGYKVRPSRFEVSPVAGEGMEPGPHVLVLKTPYGRFLVITCVDLLSDEVQYLARRMATRGEIDVVININHNPAAWEFLVEANSLVRRHPVFASITNTYILAAERAPRCMTDDGPSDSGYCNGHTAIFADLRTRLGDMPNSNARLLADLPDPVVRRDTDGNPTGMAVAYNKVVGDIGSFEEGMLVYELNMRMRRVPSETNAPDQGYPPVRDIHVVDLMRP
jgi:predicted amidohydrolase